LAVLTAMGRFALNRDLVKTNVLGTIERPAPESSRDRVLDDGEIAALMTAVKSEGYPFEPLVKLLLLTGQRRSEVAEMRWSEIDLDGKLWTLPKERARNGREHVLPLAPDVFDIVGALPRIDSSDLVFTTNGIDHITASIG